MYFGNERETNLLAKEFGLVPFVSADLPEYAPDFPVKAFVIVRERTYPDKLNTEMFGATGHSHYAWGGTWESNKKRILPWQRNEVPLWVPVIRDYREMFVVFFALNEAKSEASKRQGTVVLAYLNSKKIVAREYEPLARELLRKMNSTEDELLKRHDELLANPKLYRNRRHLEAMAHSINAVRVCHVQIANLAPPQMLQLSHSALMSYSGTVLTAADLYAQSFFALEKGEFDEAQRLLSSAGRQFEAAEGLRKRALTSFFDR